MNYKEKLFKELITFSNQHLYSRDHFLCIYGSYASGHNTSVSDLDMFIAIKDYDSKDFEKFRNFVIDLHIRNGLNLDDEVPYENKLIVSYEDIEHAIALKSFVQNKDNYHVPVVEKSDEFLASPEIRWRLILNAFTSPHKCVCGNENIYLDFRTNIEKSIVKLAHGLAQSKNPTSEELFEVLICGENGEEGEMYLGYKKECEEVMEYLKDLILRNYKNNI